MIRTRTALSAVVPALALCAGSASAITPSFSIALRAGNNIAGVGNVTTIDDLDVNNQGKWVVECDTDNPNTNIDQVVVLNGVLHFQQGQALAAPPNATISSFDSVNLNNNADIGWNLFLGGQTTNTDSGVYYNGTLVIWESQISTSPAFTNPTPYIGFFEVKMNDANQMIVVASIDDPAIPTTVDRAMVRVDYNAGMNTFVENVIMKEGDLILGNAIADFGTGPHQFAINAGGDVMYLADTTAVTTIDGFLMKNTTVIAQEGVTVVSGTGGRMHEILLGRGLDMNNNGDWVIRGNLTGDTLTDECIIRNNTIVAQEGTTLPSISPFLFQNFGLAGAPVAIDNAGNVVYFGDWDDPDTSRDTGIFWNDQLIVQEGVTMVGGLLVFSIANGEDSLAMSDNGEWLIFECTLRDVNAGINYNAAVLVNIPAPGAAVLLATAGLIGLRRRR